MIACLGCDAFDEELLEELEPPDEELPEVTAALSEVTTALSSPTFFSEFSVSSAMTIATMKRAASVAVKNRKYIQTSLEKRESLEKTGLEGDRPAAGDRVAENNL